MSRNLDDLVPEVQFKARHALAALDDKGTPHIVTSTKRSDDEQIALHAQGRHSLDVVQALRQKAGMPPLNPRDNTYTVTNADGVKFKSNHQGGRAIDVVPTVNGLPVWPAASDPRWRQIADVFKAAGFDNGLDWISFPDPPHHEIA